MGKKRIPHLDSNSLYKMGNAGKAQQLQLLDVEEEAAQIKQGLEELEQKQKENVRTGAQLINELENFLGEIEGVRVPSATTALIESAFSEYEKKSNENFIASSYNVKRAKEILTNNNWDSYYGNIVNYAEKAGMNLQEDPFLTMLSESQYQVLSETIDKEFAKKTSIRNKTDLKFLAIAIVLEVTKGLLFPVVAEKMEYGRSFDPADRLDHNDKVIKNTEKEETGLYRDKKMEKYGTGEWIELLYRSVPYDITAGTGNMEDINLHAGQHRLYTLGHDPILGWIFGTANILTDTITMTPGAIVIEGNSSKIADLLKIASIRSYRIIRKPKMKVTEERVSLLQLFEESYNIIREHPMNLPAAVFKQSQHLKSDVYTKLGLPVPVVEMFSPEFASKLYSNHYDALCLERDVKVVGSSAILSIVIDILIGLIHGLYYDTQKDGSRDLFEVRTRKILLVANTIGTGSNLIYTYLSKNARSLDIGGLLITLSHLFTDTRFLVRIKQEFIENRLYEKIASEIDEIDEIEKKLMDYDYEHRNLYRQT